MLCAPLHFATDFFDFGSGERERGRERERERERERDRGVIGGFYKIDSCKNG